jgi:chaperonin GroES
MTRGFVSRKYAPIVAGTPRERVLACPAETTPEPATVAVAGISGVGDGTSQVAPAGIGGREATGRTRRIYQVLSGDTASASRHRRWRPRPGEAPLTYGAMPARGDHARGDTKQAIRVTTDRLLVQPSKEAGDRKSRAGILIPATADVSRRLVWAEVVQVGPTVRNIETGDQVLFAPDSGFETEIQGEDYLILRERDVHAVASERTEGQTGLYL